MTKDTRSLKTLVRGHYDLQKVRIQIGLRLVANFKAKLGQAPSTRETELDSEAKAILERMREAYRRLSDASKSFSKIIKQRLYEGDEVISSAAELVLIQQYFEVETAEAALAKNINLVLDEYPIWTLFLKGVKGCGPLMSGVLISELDPARARYVSSFWKYAGLDVASDGKGRSRKKDHLIEVEYQNKDGKAATRNSITFNPFLKTKLYVLAGCFIKLKDGHYRSIYDGYKHRLENHVDHVEKTKGHRHAMAMRYMIKIFLQDLYLRWREIEGLPVNPPYSESKLGLRHTNVAVHAV